MLQQKEKTDYEINAGTNPKIHLKSDDKFFFLVHIKIINLYQFLIENHKKPVLLINCKWKALQNLFQGFVTQIMVSPSRKNFFYTHPEFFPKFHPLTKKFT